MVDEGFVSNIYKHIQQFIQFNVKKKKKLVKKWAEKLSRHFSKEEMQMANKYMKRCMKVHEGFYNSGPGLKEVCHARTVFQSHFGLYWPISGPHHPILLLQPMLSGPLQLVLMHSLILNRNVGPNYQHAIGIRNIVSAQ